jgi:hypothetical protein
MIGAVLETVVPKCRLGVADLPLAIELNTKARGESRISTGK